MVDKIRRAQPGDRASAGNINDMLRSVMRGIHGSNPVMITQTHGRIVIALDEGFIAAALGGGGGAGSLRLGDLLELFEEIINGRKLAVWHIVENKEELDALEVSAPALGYTTDNSIAWVKLEGEAGETGIERPWVPIYPWNEVEDYDELLALDVEAPALGLTKDDNVAWVKRIDNPEETGEDPLWLPMHTLRGSPATDYGPEFEIPGAIMKDEENTYIRRGDKWVPLHVFDGPPSSTTNMDLESAMMKNGENTYIRKGSDWFPLQTYDVNPTFTSNVELKGTFRQDSNNSYIRRGSGWIPFERFI